jgi:UDP-glucose 4-epimerase
MYEDFLTLSLEQIVNQAAKHRYMSGGQLKVPLTIRTQGGAGWSPGAQHAQQLEAWFVHIPGLKVVFASTGGAIYGECDGPAPETAERRPLSPYGTSKLCGEEYLATWNRLYGTSHVTLRLGNVYGARQEPSGEAGVVSIFMGALRDGGAPRIYGDGRQTRDYVHVADVVRAMLAALEADGGVFNVGTGVETSVLDLSEAIARVTGIERAPTFAPARQGELQRSVLDTRLAADELGFGALVDLKDGLRSTWEWLRKE